MEGFLCTPTPDGYVHPSHDHGVCQRNMIEIKLVGWCIAINSHGDHVCRTNKSSIPHQAKDDVLECLHDTVHRAGSLNLSWPVSSSGTHHAIGWTFRLPMLSDSDVWVDYLTVTYRQVVLVALKS